MSENKKNNFLNGSKKNKFDLYITDVQYLLYSIRPPDPPNPYPLIIHLCHPRGTTLRPIR